MTRLIGYFGVLGLMCLHSAFAEVPTVLFPDGNWEALYSWRKAVCKATESGVQVTLQNGQRNQGELRFVLVPAQQDAPASIEDLEFVDRDGTAWSVTQAESACTFELENTVQDELGLKSFSLQLSCKYLGSSGSFSRSIQIKNPNPVRCELRK